MGIGWPAWASPTASWGGGARPRGGGLAGDEGRGRSTGLWGDLSGREGWGGHGESSGGVWVGAGAPEGGGPWRSGSAAALELGDGDGGILAAQLCQLGREELGFMPTNEPLYYKESQADI